MGAFCTLDKHRGRYRLAPEVLGVHQHTSVVQARKTMHSWPLKDPQTLHLFMHIVFLPAIHSFLFFASLSSNPSSHLRAMSLTDGQLPLCLTEKRFLMAKEDSSGNRATKNNRHPIIEHTDGL